MSLESREIKSSLKVNSDKRICSSGDRIEVYLFVNDNSKRKVKYNYIVRIAIINGKDSFVKVHFWDVTDNKATIKTSKPRKSRFRKRKANYMKVGETKMGKKSC